MDQEHEQRQWSTEALDRQLSNVYYAAGDPGSYGGLERLYQRARNLGIPVTRDRVRTFLTKQLSYTLHRPVRHNFKRNHTYVGHIDQQWQADLADMQQYATENDGYRYILTCTDVLSRFAWTVPTRSKSAVDMVAAIKQLLRSARPRRPQRLQTDKGKEFFNAQVSSLLRKHGIQHFASNSDKKAAIVERFNRTLKNRIFAYFTANNTTRYVDVLGDIVAGYNASYHRSIGMRPADVDNDEAAQKAWSALFYDSTHKGERINPIPENHRVRISRWKGEFEKGYMPNWSREHFLVRAHEAHPHALYKLEDAAGEPVEGLFYSRELQPIPKNTLQVERVLRERRVRGNHKEYFVKWRGWPDKFNRWVSHAELRYYRLPPRERNDDDAEGRVHGNVAEQQ
jgi:transposase InsO family protein